MPPVEITEDLYAILEIHNTATLQEITRSYRRLALVRHPDRNFRKPDATACFQLLGKAYDTLKDANLRCQYDSIWPGLRQTQRAQGDAEDQEAKATGNGEECAAEDEETVLKEDKARQARLHELGMRRSRYDTDIFECRRCVRRLVAEIQRYQQQDAADVLKDRERGGWWTSVTLGVYSAPAETEEQKQEREAERLQRIASRRIKENQLKEAQGALKIQENALEKVEHEIEAETRKKERAQAAKEQAQAAKEQAWAAKEQLRREREQLRRKEEMKREAAEQLLRMRQARQAWNAQESARRAEAERKRNEEAEEASATCNHKRYWAKIDGQHLCSHCSHRQTLYAFECPTCGTIACANCRGTLRGEGQHS